MILLCSSGSLVNSSGTRQAQSSVRGACCLETLALGVPEEEGLCSEDGAAHLFCWSAGSAHKGTQILASIRREWLQPL